MKNKQGDGDQYQAISTTLHGGRWKSPNWKKRYKHQKFEFPNGQSGPRARGKEGRSSDEPRRKHPDSQ